MRVCVCVFLLQCEAVLGSVLLEDSKPGRFRPTHFPSAFVPESTFLCLFSRCVPCRSNTSTLKVFRGGVTVSISRMSASRFFFLLFPLCFGCIEFSVFGNLVTFCDERSCVISTFNLSKAACLVCLTTQNVIFVLFFVFLWLTILVHFLSFLGGKMETSKCKCPAEF